MVNLPEIVILIITYDRYDELKQTMYALQSLAHYPKDKLHVVVSDDSTGGTKLANLSRIKAFQAWGDGGIDIIETEQRSGWGKHVNWAINKAKEMYPKAEYIFQIEDDYVLQSELDLAEGVALLDARPNIGMLRYRGTAGGHYIYHQFEAETAVSDGGKTTYLQLDNASHNLYVYSNGAHLKRLRSKDGYDSFHEFYGAYDEGRKLGETEEMFAHRVKDKMKQGNAPAIAILPDWVNMHFDHIGKSFQNTEVDIEG